MEQVQPTPTLKENSPVEETHNYCTKEKCAYHPANQSARENANPCLANFCVGCGVNMGDCNPRQYCYKLYCPFEDLDENVDNNNE